MALIVVYYAQGNVKITTQISGLIQKMLDCAQRARLPSKKLKDATTWSAITVNMNSAGFVERPTLKTTILS